MTRPVNPRPIQGPIPPTSGPRAHSTHSAPDQRPPPPPSANSPQVRARVRPRPPVGVPSLPGWIPPSQNGQPGRDHLNSTGTEQSRRVASVSAEGTVLPIIYGEDIIGPIISLAKVIGSELVLRCIWCLGEVEQIVSVTLEDGTVIQGVTMTHYVGRDDQQPDPFLVANIPGYADTCTVPIGDEVFGVAYSVIRVPANANVGFPRFVARVKGRRVRDPRGTAYYTNYSSSFAFTGFNRMKLGYEGTAHNYTSAPNTQAKRVATGQADSAVGTLMMAISPNGAGDNSVLFDCGGGKLQVIWATGNFIRVVGKNAASTTVLDATSTTALTAAIPHTVVISWDLNQNLVIIRTDDVDCTPGSFTATSGQTINLSAAGVSVGGAYAGTNLHAGKIAAVGFYTEFHDIRTQVQIGLFLDAQHNLVAPPFAATSGAIWEPNGWMATSGFTYTNNPIVNSVAPDGWTLAGTASFQKYVYPSYKGGAYFSNLAGDTAFYMAQTAPVNADGLAIRTGLYWEADVKTGAMEVYDVATTTSFMSASASTQQALDYQSPAAGGNQFRMRLLSATSTTARLVKFNVYPESNSYETRFMNLDNGGDWFTIVHNAGVADAVLGGFYADANDVVVHDNAENIFASGEEVFYELFFDANCLSTHNTWTLEIGGQIIVIADGNGLATDQGMLKGSVVTTNQNVQFDLTFDGSSDLTVKRLKLSTKPVAKTYTKTPALILADLLESRAYGLGGQVDDASLLVACQFNEERIYDNGQARHEIGLSMVERDSITSWLETLRAYARCFIVPRGNEYFLVPDRPGNYVGDITPSSIVKDSFKPSKKSLRNLPNVVKVFFTNTATTPWTEDSVEAVSPAVLRGDEYRRETAIRLPGIQTKSMAYRFAVERLNDSTLIDLVGAFSCMDTAWKYEIGDIVRITHPIGLTNKQVRILSIDPQERGIINVQFSEYDANVYSDAIVDEPPPPDNGGVTPFQVPALTGLRLEERFYVSGSAVHSRLYATWNAVNYAFLQYYVAEIYEAQATDDTTRVELPESMKNVAGATSNNADQGRAAFVDPTTIVNNQSSIPPGGRLIQTIRTPDNFFDYRNISQGATYYVKVYAMSTAFVSGASQTVSIQCLGYLLPPDFSQGQIVAYEAGDGLEVYVRQGALDIDLWGYEFRYRELSDQNISPSTGPAWSSSNWSGGTANFVFASRSLKLVATTTGNITIFGLVPTNVVAGKSYDIYVKFKQLKYPPLATGAFDGFKLDDSTSPGSGMLFKVNGNDRAGLFKSDKPWVAGGTGDTLVISSQNHKYVPGGSVDDNTAFEIEYIAIREVDAEINSDWTTAQLVERSASLHCRIPNLPTGAYLVYCKALDSVRDPSHPYGQYSTTTCTAYSRVQRDDSAFFRQTYQLAPQTITNMPVYPKPSLNAGLTYVDGAGATQTLGTWCPTKPLTTWNAQITGTVNSIAVPVFGAFEGATPESWVSTIMDLGTTINGTMALWATLINLGTNSRFPGVTLEWSNASNMAGSSSQTVTQGQYVQFSGRYVRVTLTVTGNKIGLRSDTSGYLEVVATPRVETGTVTTLGPDVNGNPQPVTVTTTNAYTACTSLRAWSSTGEPVNCYCDNITPGNPSTFTVIAVDLNGQPIAVTGVNWEWKGV